MDLLSTSTLFQQFLSEPRYLKNVTQSTIEWYETAWTMLRGAVGDASPFNKSTLQQFVGDAAAAKRSAGLVQDLYQSAQRVLRVAASRGPYARALPTARIEGGEAHLADAQR